MLSNTTKFQKIQLCLSIVPHLSTAFIAIVTMFVLKKRQAIFIEWVKFSLIFFGGFITAYVYSNYLMTGKNALLNTIVETLILFIANLLLINLQNRFVSKSLNDRRSISHRKIIIIVVAIASSLFISIFLGIKVSQTLLLHSNNTINDENGSNNHSLAVISNDDIVNESYGLTMLKFSQASSGEQTMILGELKRYDYDQTMFSASEISGIRTMQATLIPRDKLILTIDSSIEEGNMGIFIMVDGEIFCEVNVNCEETIVLEDIANKTVVVRFGAEKAKASIRVTRDT